MSHRLCPERACFYLTLSIDRRVAIAVPVQRIPRYKLLLAELLKYTEESHHDFANITDALEKVTAVANDVNEAIRRQEEMSKLLELQELFGSCEWLKAVRGWKACSLTQGLASEETHPHSLATLDVDNAVGPVCTPPPPPPPPTTHTPRRCVLIDVACAILAPARKFLRQGALLKVSRKTDIQYEFFLFNDVLIYAARSGTGYQHHRTIELRTATVASAGADGGSSFLVTSSVKSFAVRASSSQEKESWMKDISDCIAANQARLGVRGTITAPLWVSDKEAHRCQKCAVEFSFFKRRHHCRRCGGVFCDTCSDFRWRLPNIDEKKRQRVCMECYHSLKGENTYGSGGGEAKQVSSSSVFVMPSMLALTGTSTCPTPSSPSLPVCRDEDQSQGDGSSVSASMAAGAAKLALGRGALVSTGASFGQSTQRQRTNSRGETAPSLPPRRGLGAIEPRLPPGWKSLVDDESGDTYFWNQDTNEVTWELPAATPPAQTKAPAAAETPALSESVGGGGGGASTKEAAADWGPSAKGKGSLRATASAGSDYIVAISDSPELLTGKQDSTCLQFSEGDQFLVVEKSESGWWLVKSVHVVPTQCGWVPSNYFEGCPLANHQGSSGGTGGLSLHAAQEGVGAGFGRELRQGRRRQGSRNAINTVHSHRPSSGAFVGDGRPIRQGEGLIDTRAAQVPGGHGRDDGLGATRGGGKDASNTSLVNGGTLAIFDGIMEVKESTDPRVDRTRLEVSARGMNSARCVWGAEILWFDYGV